MARNLLKRFIPTPAAIKSNPALHFLGDLLHDPNLFHLNRHSVSVAFFWGLFIAILPIPGQMPLAALAAWYFRCNLPIACALAWVSNPFTTPFLIYIAYEIGRFTLQFDSIKFETPPEFTWTWITTELTHLWYPLLVPMGLGCIILGVLTGTFGYFFIQIFWRWNVKRLWAKRGRERAL